MNEKEIKAKKAAIRQEIKERMQREFDERKRQIRERIRKEKISVQEKRRKYRRAVDEQKLSLMELAKEEFKARKRMLGLDPEQDRGERPHRKAPAVEPSPREEYLAEMAEAPQSRMRPEEAFIYEDEADSDIREFQSPIGEADLLPYGDELDGDEEAAAGKVRSEDLIKTKSLFYYITNLIFHPAQTLDEFDDYLASSVGLLKVLLFYILSLAPIVIFVFIGDEVVSRMPSGLFWTILGASMSGGPSVTSLLVQTVLGLLIYSLSIAVVNYFVADDANFITLLFYFAFVEGVTRVIIYFLVIVTVIAAAIASPQIVIVVALLFVAFFIWAMSLKIIVLMNAYGYGVITAFLLSVGASLVEDILRALLIGRFLGGRGF